MKKCYILDTNILESTAGAILDGLEDNDIVITMTTLNELDNHKKSPGEHGYSARESLRRIFAFTEQKKGSFEKGYQTKGGGTFRIETNHAGGEYLKGDWDMTKADNKILSAAAYLSHTLENMPVILITNDSGMYVSATLAGVKVQTYRNETIEAEELYTGRAELEVSLKALNLLYADKEYKGVPADKVIKKKNLEKLYCNEYLTLHCGTSSELCRLDNLGVLHRIKDREVFGGIRGRNAGQKFLIDALMNEQTPLVIVQGGAGTGKTLLSLACGLENTYDSKENARFDSVVITRSNTLSDADIGFLPGSLEDKMGPLVSPFLDSLRVVLKQDQREEPEQIKTQIADMFECGIIEITSIAYMRGRSLSNSFIIISEAQNLTISQAKTLATRVGVGSVIVFEGDISQIDKATLSKRSNGLVYLSEKFKGNPLCSQIVLKDSECVRSELAAEASRIL